MSPGAGEQAVAAMDGTLEAMYFAFGVDDYYAIVDMPDNVSGAAVSLATALAGAVRLKTVVLLTAEDLDEAAEEGPRVPGARRALTTRSVSPPQPGDNCSRTVRYRVASGRPVNG
jgi:GYD domain